MENAAPNNVVFVLLFAALFLSVFVISYLRLREERNVLAMKVTTLEVFYQDVIGNQCLDIAHLKAQVKEQSTPETAEPKGMLVFKAKRAPGAPPLRLYDIKEAVVIANTRADAIKILKEQANVTDDDWWLLVDVTQPEVIVKEVVP